MTYLKKAGSDFIPVWDGSLEEWENYVVRCGIFVRGVEPHKVSNRIANLIQHLEPTGEPWKMIMNLSEEERVALQVNLKTFLDFLKENCLPTALPELGRRFREWLKFKRVKKETMRVYFKRYSQQLGKMEQCMDLVQDADANFKKLMKLVKLKMVEFDRVRIRPSAGGVTSEASVHSPRDRIIPSPTRGSPQRGSPQRFSPPRVSPSPTTSPQRRLWSAPRAEEEWEEEGEEEELREED